MDYIQFAIVVYLGVGAFIERDLPGTIGERALILFLWPVVAIAGLFP